MRRRRYIIQSGTPEPPGQVLRYNHGHYTAVQHFQYNSALGTDSGTMQIVIGTGAGVVTANFVNSGVPGGHTGLIGAFGPRNTTGPASTPFTRGIVMPIYWKVLEPTTQGVYDFSETDAALATCQALGCQLVIRLETKTFDTSITPAPAYLDMAPYTITVVSGGGQTVMSRWNTFVRNRYRAAIRALIDRYDVNPYFEGIATQETAVTMSPAEQASNGYDTTDFANALQFESDSICKYATHSRHFCYQNFLPQSSGVTQAQADAALDAVCRYNIDNGSIVGGPDALPFASPLHNRTYPRYSDPAILYLRGPTFICAQHDSHTQTSNTMEELFLWATNQLTVNATRLYVDYFFWDFWANLNPNSWNPEDRDVIAKYYPNTWNSFNY